MRARFWAALAWLVDVLPGWTQRTHCVYCGERLPPVNAGLVSIARRRGTLVTALLACRWHRDLPGLDPHYNMGRR